MLIKQNFSSLYLTKTDSVVTAIDKSLCVLEFEHRHLKSYMDKFPVAGQDDVHGGPAMLHSDQHCY